MSLVFNPFTGTFDFTGAGGGGGGTTPALPFDSVQFNNAGAFGGSANFTWDGTTFTIFGPGDNPGTGFTVAINQPWLFGETTTFVSMSNMVADDIAINGQSFGLAAFQGLPPPGGPYGEYDFYLNAPSGNVFNGITYTPDNYAHNISIEWDATNGRFYFGDGSLSAANQASDLYAHAAVFTSTVTATDFIVSGSAFKTDTVDAHTALFQAYDVDGTAYKTFATLTNANTPTLVITPPSGGTVTVNATTLQQAGSAITLGGALTTSGAFGSTFTMTGTTAVTFPTSGTLATTSQIPSGAALTKGDDTNVTLTLGGSSSTALVNAASITAGWAGTLSVARGGSGAGTLTGLVLGNGTSAFTTVTAPSGTVVGTSDTQTLTNKRITKRVVTASDATSITPNSDNADITYQANTQAAGTLTINADSGTPTNGQAWVLKIKSTNVQTFSWNAIFVGGAVPLPTTTSGSSKIDYFAFVYDTVTPKWDYTGPALGY